MVRIVTASKEFGVFPLLDLPQGGGVCALSGQVSVTAAASPGAFSANALTNGHPLRKKFALKNPLVIQANQSFYMELLGPTTTAQTLTGIMQVRLELEGVEVRPAA